MSNNVPPRNPYANRQGYLQQSQEEPHQGKDVEKATPEDPSREGGSGSPAAVSAEPTPNVSAQETHDAIARLVAENADLKDRLLRALADAENVRRRAERDLNDVRQYAVTRFAGDMVNVADNLERAMSSLPAELRNDAGPFKTFVEGVELTEKELLRSLEAHGVKKLDPTGSPFDPRFHEAMFQVQDPSVRSGTVTTVVQPGYSIGSRSLRPAKVGVAS
ncbi:MULTISPECIES: nucleotide exchange factor GrpE [Bradyrhizobium]|uniref:nucleotide exchange factor GrpE n=1 Tax=Bradyrhizobium TaxID=374 RepID=UPI0009B6B1C4|nr:nucleotide exchange factor GrpE [Bradyrhizobium elkanii]MCS3520214.1 molecular chaperone GrpE [Bradyrhizobium elkanii]MCS4067869.1 molecular chaperone GrpE [Bradyrhizobium elkanii]MCS4083405.1 molecular chaperone GrpE [Bradyrhizobium elkanii]MCW2126968.1 molecular chaperone GrpE [Bradyrhizobium elkanii]MCW2173715.1 molecular chaperone GrpE [Bradyrhizobium elkanii]